MNSEGKRTGARVLVIDDTPAIHDDFRKIFAPQDDEDAFEAAAAALFRRPSAAGGTPLFSVDTALQGQEGLDCVRRALAEGIPYAVAFVDMRMPPGWDGIETVRHLWQSDPRLQIVMCTAYSDHTWRDMVREFGVTDQLIVLKKPFDSIEVLQMAHALARKWQLARRLESQVGEMAAEIERRTAALRMAELRFTAAFDANPLALAIQAKADRRLLAVNQAFLALGGWKENQVVGQTPERLALWEGEDLPHATAGNEGRGLRKAPAKLRTADGALRDVVVSNESIEVENQACLLWLIDDVTEKLVLEQRLLHAQKMESIGHLAAGIAHDFNNLLTVINVYSEEGLQECAPGTRLHGALQEVNTAGRRAAALTRQLLIFSRKQYSAMVPVDLLRVLDDTLPILRRMIGEGLQLVAQFQRPLPSLIGDENNLVQIVYNLVVNARDAMPGGGTVRLSLREVSLDAATATARHRDARAGRFLLVQVSDDGCGIPAESHEKVFEPFYTTKNTESGTGLGLSTARMIVQQHGGWIELESAVGRGSTFGVFLPVASKDGDAGARGVQASAATTAHDASRPSLASFSSPVSSSTAPAASRPAPPPMRGRLLVAEDEDLVRSMLSSLLRRNGYQVTMAEDGHEALARWHENQGAYDLLLTDMVMPKGMTGLELAQKLREIKPHLKVLIMSGYSIDLLEQGAADSPLLAEVGVMLKPFKHDDLLRRLREALG